MTLYKFRSLENFEFTADILINKRLYAAQFFELNDPMEGIFTHSVNEEQSLLKAIKDEKSKLRICSLSRNMKNPIVWAHYANGFKGICIEIEVDDTIVDKEEVIYTPVDPLVGGNLTLFEGNTIIKKVPSPAEWARITLQRKFEEWEYEDEIRLFSREKFINEGINIKAVYLGTRISDINKEVIQKIVESGIKIYETEFNSSNEVVKKE